MTKIHVFDDLDVTTGWTALGNDTANIATTQKHVHGAAALTFDKVDGAANSIHAGIQKTINSVQLGPCGPRDVIRTSLYLPTLTDVAYAWVRVGTDASNYNEWRIADSALTAATFMGVDIPLCEATYAGVTGNGWNTNAITYIAVGVAFDAAGNTLAGIVFDFLGFSQSARTDSLEADLSLGAVTATITSPVGAGTAAAAVRTTLASDDPLVANAGAIADAASATGSLSAKLRLLASAVKLEDDASANLDPGLVILAKRNDDDYEGGGGSGANGDYQLAQMYGPNLLVRVTASNTAADNTKSIAAREDDASANNAAGVKTLAVRRDAPTQSAGTDGDFCFTGVSADGGAWEQGAFKAGTAVVDASLVADYTSAAHDCRGYNAWMLDYQVADNAAGVMYIQGSQDGTNHWQDIPLDTASVRINAGGVAWTGVTVAATGITHTDPGAAGAKVSMTFENPMPYMRYFFDRTGGDAAGLDSQSALQAF